MLGGLPDVHIACPGNADDQLPGLVTIVGAMHMHETSSAEGASPATESAPAAADPLAMRLALMSHQSDRAADLDERALASASDLATQWRDQVAAWAESPSRPMPPRIRAALDAAFDDLDTPTALQLLTSLATEADVPDGARFETFAFADRVLGLELAREVGRPRR
jgi:cysteinyl-tRNA synthetase